MTTSLVDDVQAIYRAALRGVQPAALLATYETPLWRTLDTYRHIYVIGAGKASMAMAGHLETALGERLTTGIVIVPHGYVATFPPYLTAPERIAVQEAGHPVSDAAGQQAAAQALALTDQAGPDDLVLALISGGGSALWSAPADGLTLADIQQAGRLLLHCGADIHEVNTVRKHLSCLKGGQLAARIAPATLHGFVISDVVGDDLSVIASGPTVPDPTTFTDARAVVRRYGIWEHLPEAVQRHLIEGCTGNIPDTPTSDGPCFQHSTTHLIGTNRSALEAAAAEATKRGYQPEVITSSQTGEARIVGTQQAEHLLQQRSDQPLCLLWGGETTVTVTGSGRGGRNQELALAAAVTLDKAVHDTVLLSGGTDGVDGPTDAAGAWATPATLTAAQSVGVDAHTCLANNDAYRFFDAIDGFLKPGPTHTNVMDIQIGLIRSS